MTHVSLFEVEKLLHNKWKEYKNLNQTATRSHDKRFAHHGMIIVRSLERDLKAHVDKKKSVL